MERGCRQNAAFFIVALWAMAFSQERAESLDTAFNSKAARLLTEERLDPKCFTQQLDDLACFWETSEPPRKGENQTMYIFRYKFEDETILKHCNLTVEYTVRNTTRYTCIFPRSYIAAFVALEVQVFDGHAPNSSLYARTIWVDQLVFLDPPSNLTVQLMEMPGQLNVSWHPPYLEYMGPSIQYEVMVTREGFKAWRLDIPIGQTSCLIKNLKGQSRYTFAVRAKPDGISYNGFWSAWSQTVTVVIPSGLDPLILTLSVVLVLIILLLAFITMMSNRRFLKKKIWPVIPTPEHEFKDLFTIYKGNFQLWLGHQSTYLWWSQNPLHLEDQPFLVEIVSECDSHKMVGPPPLPPKTRGLMELPPSPALSQEDYLVLDEDFVPCPPGGDGSLLLMHSGSCEGTDLAFAKGAETPEPSQTSSSFEYTVFDPSSESLSPRNHQTELQLKKDYQMVSDSGISADYSPVGSNEGQTSLYTNLCEGQLQQQSFLPTYIVCS
ncbi:erythropoietin receptor [Tiliqua scincoides]|uniref:erythropoietin receptor n=1 Tax=Tiliqua scincoides TaxID=71010 RepID=UPI0034635517